jgi:hypothetical protein
LRITNTVRGLLSQCRLIAVAWPVLGAAPAAPRVDAVAAFAAAAVLLSLLLGRAGEAGGRPVPLLPRCCCCCCSEVSGKLSDPLRLICPTAVLAVLLLLPVASILSLLLPRAMLVRSPLLLLPPLPPSKESWL